MVLACDNCKWVIKIDSFEVDADTQEEAYDKARDYIDTLDEEGNSPVSIRVIKK